MGKPEFWWRNRGFGGETGVFVVKSEGKEPLGKSKLRWKGNNKLVFNHLAPEFSFKF